MEKKNKRMKESDVLNYYAGMVEVVKEKKVFGGAVNLALAKNNKILEEEVKAYQESLEKLVDKFVHKDADGKPETKKQSNGTETYVFERDEQEKAYRAAVNALGETEIDVQINTISYKEFNEEGADRPTAYDLIVLQFMIED